jgi:hypothetical protein
LTALNGVAPQEKTSREPVNQTRIVRLTAVEIQELALVESVIVWARLLAAVIQMQIAPLVMRVRAKLHQLVWPALLLQEQKNASRLENVLRGKVWTTLAAHAEKPM